MNKRYYPLVSLTLGMIFLIYGYCTPFLASEHWFILALGILTSIIGIFINKDRSKMLSLVAVVFALTTVFITIYLCL